ncbi:MAG: phytoene desaturase, partial [Lysobacterales bacterium]
MSKRIVVIGGGLGGLSAACTLAARGNKVQLFEANATLGGKAAVLENGGFRFDMGPTIITLPDVLRRIFEEAGRPLEDYVTLTRLDPQWRCFFEDGTTLDLTADASAMHSQLDRFGGPNTAAGYARFMATAKELHRISEQFFFWKSVGGLRDTLDVRQTFKASTLADLAALRLGQSVAGTIRRAVPDERVAQMLDHFTQYVGSSPYGSPAVLCGIAHMQTAGGVWYPSGGTRALPAALTKLARELGVEITTGAAVERILEAGGSAHGIRLADGRSIEADAVVSNMDTVRTHEGLLSTRTSAKFRRRRRYEPACSGVVLYLGLNKRYEHLLHHNFVFSADP